jgi:hypothetical protein
MKKKSVLFYLSIMTLFLFSQKSFSRSILIGAIGDMNSTECQPFYPSNSLTAYKNMVVQNKLDQIIMPGDVVHGECLSYSGSTPYQNVVKRMWQEFNDKFFNTAIREFEISPIVAPGNHDAPFITSSSRSTFKIEDAGFRTYWTEKKDFLKVTPLNIVGANDNYPYYWAYMNEGVMFIVLQSVTTYKLSNGVLQKTWLKALLNSDIAKETKVKIAFGHIPIYPVLSPSVGSKYSEFISSEQVGKTDSLMDILLNGNVSLLVMGHSHAAYPGELTRKSDQKKITILSMPCSHAPRKLYSKSVLSDRGYALIEVKEDFTIKIGIRRWQDGGTISYDYFPATIGLKDTKIEYKKISKGMYF